MQVLIIYAHPEPTSFNGAMRDSAVESLSAAGHAVTVSDLYAIRFNPVAGPGDVMDRHRLERFKIEDEQAWAHEHQAFAPDIAAEQAKVLAADLLIFQFPLWGWSFPAIMKGWIDRVLAGGFAHAFNEWYDNGRLKGRRAMLSFTTAAPEISCRGRGMNGDIDELLYHIHHGQLYWAGFSILRPFIAWGVPFIAPEARTAILGEWRARLAAIEHEAPLPYRRLADFDARGVLQDGLPRDFPTAATE